MSTDNLHAYPALSGLCKHAAVSTEKNAGCTVLKGTLTDIAVTMMQCSQGDTCMEALHCSSSSASSSKDGASEEVWLFALQASAVESHCSDCHDYQPQHTLRGLLNCLACSWHLACTLPQIMLLGSWAISCSEMMQYHGSAVSQLAEHKAVANGLHASS